MPEEQEPRPTPPHTPHPQLKLEMALSLPMGCRGLTSDPLQEQEILLISEPPFSTQLHENAIHKST